METLIIRTREVPDVINVIHKGMQEIKREQESLEKLTEMI
jgi:hypothetical protein